MFMVSLKHHPGQAETAASQAKLLEDCAQQWEEASSCQGALPVWKWGLLVTCFVKEPGNPVETDYLVVMVWPRADVSLRKHYIFHQIYATGSTSAVPPKPALLPWEMVKKELCSNKDFFCKRGMKLYFKVVEYLKLSNEQDASGHISRWLDSGHITSMDNEDEIVKGSGAFNRKRQESKGGKGALFLRCALLRRIHQARLARRL